MRGTSRLAKIEALISVLKDKLRPRLPILLSWAPTCSADRHEAFKQLRAYRGGIVRHEDGSLDIRLGWPEQLQEDVHELEGGNEHASEG